jgi:hypothetical protein
MQTNESGSWSPPFRHTGEYPRVSASRGQNEPRIGWSEEERRWWDELTHKSPERNTHFETEGRAGIAE